MLIEQLKKHEGFRPDVYTCTADKPTIGYGRNLEANPFTPEEAEVWLVEAVSQVEEELKRHFNVTRLSNPRAAVLINMAYNLGVPRLMGFAKMFEALDQSDFDTAAKEMLDSRWAKQVGIRATELSEQMRTGEWQNQ
ncbi:glycoside hydrolase family protein [Algicola sagamiensis]|uniref:glycoside hydrolase family protein n=1 Tax=Algicola sagamiensis TaxID=163869 RepID=UPI00037B0FEF|nr:glycoside hydrolase family protein [Algicola sagamiensis]